MVTWNDLVGEAGLRMAEAGIDDAEVCARWIGRQATGTDATEWASVANADATERQVAAFDRMVERRCSGEPLQYVLGEWGFRTLDLFVDARVLIPRPETEIVTAKALEEIDRVKASSSDALVVADLGTGSGAIGLSMAAERRGNTVWLTDVSSDALDVARANLAGLGSAGVSVHLAHGAWFEALGPELAGRLAVVVSNPPYVASAGDAESQVVDWEPEIALLAAGDGMAHLRQLVAESPTWLRSDGALVLEMAPDQVDDIAALAAGYFGETDRIIDLADRPRGIVARWPLGQL